MIFVDIENEQCQCISMLLNIEMFLNLQEMTAENAASKGLSTFDHSNIHKGGVACVEGFCSI